MKVSIIIFRLVMSLDIEYEAIFSVYLTIGYPTWKKK